jgi:ubiquinone/menaquinone biosynthesis C-methylase UbiE
MQNQIIKGHVDVLKYNEICGWIAGNEEVSKPRVVEIFIDGSYEASVLANLFRPDLLKAGISDGFSGFKYVPIKIDLMSHHEVLIKDQETNSILAGASTIDSIVDKLITSCDEIEDFALLIETQWENDSVVLIVDYISSIDDARYFHVEGGDLIESKNINKQKIQIFEKIISRYKLKINPLSNKIIKISSKNIQNSNLSVLNNIYTTKKPILIFDCLDHESMTRVSGPDVKNSQFAATGLQTASRVVDLYEMYSQRNITLPLNILDWGGGCGRVAIPLKNFYAINSHITSVDVDEWNINTAKKFFNNLDSKLIDFSPPLPFDDNKFDLIYGISVMTHLTEISQLQWLYELKRISKPGALIILTIHGPFSIINAAKNRQNSIVIDTIERGISFDSPDLNLGVKLPDKNYYRATFHTQEYINKIWSKFFKILKIHTGSNVFVQDFIILENTR